MPKIKPPGILKTVRRSPLHAEILKNEERLTPAKPALKRRSASAPHEDGNVFGALEVAGNVVDTRTSMKILHLAEVQQLEDLAEHEVARKANSSEHGSNDDSSTYDADALSSVGSDGEFAMDGPQVHQDGDFVSATIDEAERHEYTSTTSRDRVRAAEKTDDYSDLADLVQQRRRQREQTARKNLLDAAAQGDVDFEPQKSSDGGLDPQVVEAYNNIAQFLAHYRSGKLPKAFKIIPRLSNWEEILYLTQPVNWTPNAMREATRLFSSNLTARMAQRFYSLVLLPAAREDIAANKKLNVHYYDALKRAMFKPAAWFKGILFPLLLDDCSLTEIIIFGSVISKVSIPAVHVSAALIRITELHHGDPRQWSSATAYIMSIMLNKKSALPVSVIHRSVSYFKTFLGATTTAMPVAWYRSMLTLVQRYKHDLTRENILDLRSVLRVHTHPLFAPEIRRELDYAQHAVDAM